MTYHNGRQVTKAATIDYAANAGDAQGYWHAGPGDMNAAKTFDWNSGNAQQNNGISYARSKVRIGDIRDGTTNTYLIGEKYLKIADYGSGNDPADDFGMYEGCAFDTYRWTWQSNGSGWTPLQDNQTLVENYRFGSPHPGGCQFVLCDGSVKNVTFSVDAVLHSRFGNRMDGQVTSHSGL
jgi:prepilin-type processing-associated H-X9-DG protein